MALTYRRTAVRDPLAGMLSDWFGIELLQARVLVFLWRASAPVRLRALEAVLGSGASALANACTELRRALPPGSLPFAYAKGYQLTEIGRSAVKEAMDWTVNEIVGGELTASRARIANLEAALELPDNAPDMPHLRPVQRDLYRVLCTGKPISREKAWTMLYAARPDCDQPNERVIDVHVCHLRKRLPEGERIDTLHGYGWRLVRDAA